MCVIENTKYYLRLHVFLKHTYNAKLCTDKLKYIIKKKKMHIDITDNKIIK